MSQNGRIRLVLSEAISTRLREEQRAIFEELGLLVSLSELARRNIEAGLAHNTRHTDFRVSSAAPNGA